MMDRRARIAGRRLAAARQAAGLTQAQLAEQAGVSYQEISHYEHGRRKPPIDRAIRIARALDCDVSDIWMTKEAIVRVSELVDRLERAGRPDLADQVRAARAALRPTGPELSPEEIRSIRQRHGLTMRQMADMLGVSETAVCRWEAGVRRPSPDRRRQLLAMGRHA